MLLLPLLLLLSHTHCYLFDVKNELSQHYYTGIFFLLFLHPLFLLKYSVCITLVEDDVCVQCVCTFYLLTENVAVHPHNFFFSFSVFFFCFSPLFCVLSSGHGDSNKQMHSTVLYLKTFDASEREWVWKN